MPPIQANKQQLNINIQKNILCIGLKAPLRIIAFFIIYGKKIKIIIDKIIIKNPESLPGILLKIA
jgi:hypothetical protein